MAIKVTKFAEVDFAIVSGSDLSQVFIWESTPDTAIDITGYTFTFILSATKGGAAIITTTGVITDAANGKWELKVESTALTGLADDTTYYYKIQDDDASGGEYYQIVGEFIQYTK